MRIGQKRARFTIRILDNKTNKTKSFVFDNDIEKIETLQNLIKILLQSNYLELSKYKHQHVCKECFLPYGTNYNKDNGKCQKCTYAKRKEMAQMRRKIK